MPDFTHVLMLKSGQVLRVGTKEKLLNSRLLSDLFSTPVKLKSRGSRYKLSLQPTPA